MQRCRIQIAGVSTQREAHSLCRIGIDALGFTLRLPTGVHDGLTEAKARAIIASLPPFISTVGITYITDCDEAIDFCRYLGCTVLQLHAPVTPSMVSGLRAALPYVKIIRAVCVTGDVSVEQARKVAEETDALIVDTYDPVTGHRGATGKVHDWRISARIVAECTCPVILAGGLLPENVTDAIRQVRPWGVDVHTGIENEKGERCMDKASAFIARVTAAEELTPS